MERIEASGDAKFDAWFKAVDSAVDRAIGLSVMDLPDCCFRDWFDDGVKPAAAAKRALRNAGGEF